MTQPARAEGVPPLDTSVAVLTRNAAANVIRGASAAAVTIVMPLLLARQLSTDEYSVWVLIVQVAAYLAWLDLGLQQTVGRSIAVAHAKGDRDEESTVVSSAFVLLGMIAAAACVVGVVCAWAAPHWWAIPADSTASTRVGILALTAAVTVSHLASPLAAELVGRQRLELSAAITLAANVLSIAGVAVAASRGASIAEMAALLAAFRGAGVVVQGIVGYQIGERPAVGRRLVRAETVRSLTSLTATYAVFGVGMLLVTGLDTAIVGAIDFDATGSYGIAAGPVTFLAGMALAITSPLLPYAAAASTDPAGGSRLRRLVLRASRLGASVNVGIGLVLVVFADDLVRNWVGAEYLPLAADLLRVLALANVVRLLPLAYVTVAIGTGSHRPLRLPAIAEGIVNVGASVGLGLAYGPIGVALGTIVGAAVSVSIIAVYSVPRSTTVPVSARELRRHVLQRPIVLTGLAAAIWYAVIAVDDAPSLLVRLVAAAAMTGAAVVFIPDRDDRDWVRRTIRRTTGRAVPPRH